MKYVEINLTTNVFFVTRVEKLFTLLASSDIVLLVSYVKKRFVKNVLFGQENISFSRKNYVMIVAKN